MQPTQTERTLHDLSHYGAGAGKVGRLMTVTSIPVLPGDGAELDIVGALRLSPLLRGMTLDTKVDLAAFYVPYRQIYGDDWINFIEQGADETVTLPGEDIGFFNSYMGKQMSGNVPLWIPEGYRQIWNEYYRPPVSVAKRTTSFTDLQEQLWGLECANLKRIWSTGVPNNVTPSDYEVDVTSGELSLLDLSQQQGHYRTEIEREFFNVRYRDIVNSFGGHTQTSADERPTLLVRSSFWASGYDVDGTDVASLGKFSGRVSQAFRFKVPRWHVPEHGTIWVMALVRFPPIFYEERNYLEQIVDPTYADISGDPAIYENMPPVSMTGSDLFRNGSGASLGYMPFGQWYRTQANNVHSQYTALAGYPFLDANPSNITEAVLVNSEDYDNMFQTLQLGHYNFQCTINAPFMRRLPSARSSIMAGTNEH